ncbi:glycosyltransferase family 4 protein [Parapedobacter deserti]|uniref:Glycosyltransferase family 4 protein n=1 Tax=Parapedobacter deserti TaxID=1912957 RepID=A0ABV7JSY7_9SPHI
MAGKICLVSNTGWSFVRFRIDVIKSLVAAGYEVLLLMPADAFARQLASLGAKVVLLQSLYPKGLNPVKDIMLYREFKRIYREEKPDLIIQYTIKPNIYSTWAAKRYGIPTIAVITGLGYAFINKGVVTAIAKQLYRLTLRKTERVWFLNRDDLDFFVSHGLVDHRRAFRIPGEGVNCVDTFNPELFLPAADRGVFRFLFVGRLLYDKGIAEFVEAAKRIKRAYPDTVFLVLGYLNVENPAAVQETRLNEWIGDGWIRYLGAVDDVRSVLVDCDCVVLPSYREGMSTTLQESAAMGKPLIASDIPGCKELIDDGDNGYLCRVKDVDSLTACMERMINLSQDMRRSMGQKGRDKMIKEYSVDRIISIYNATITEILGEKK